MRQMGKDTKIVHFSMIGGNTEDLKGLAMALNEMKKKTELDIEFLVTDDKVQLHSVKYLIDNLYKLYKDMKKLKETKEAKNDKV